MNVIGRFLYKIIARLFKFDNKYVSRVKGSNKWVYISYIPEVFYNTWNKKYMNGHQSRQEMVNIVRLFNNKGYNVYVSNYANYTLPSLNVEIVFGIEPGFIFACKKYSTAKKIYYATGAYFKHQNNMIKIRTDAFNIRFNAHFPYQRLINFTNHIEYADKILQIGSKYTIDTYPQSYRNKITTIHQSSTIQNVNKLTIEYAKENEYMWIGGGGSILKGLDLIFDYFIVNKQKKIHIVGNIDEEFLNIYEGKITSNIIIHGYMDLTSSKFADLVKSCNYLIYPSCTEGGCPGAVINGMAYGLIPIVSQWAAFDEIEEFGYLLDDISIDSIANVIESLSCINKEDCLYKKIKCAEFVMRTYNLKRFTEEFDRYIQSI